MFQLVGPAGGCAHPFDSVGHHVFAEYLADLHLVVPIAIFNTYSGVTLL